MSRPRCSAWPDKVRYETLKAAHSALRRMPRHMSANNHPYQCGDHYHVGRLVRQTFRTSKKKTTLRRPPKEKP